MPPTTRRNWADPETVLERPEPPMRTGIENSYHLLAPGPLSAPQNMALDDLLLDQSGWFLRLTRWQQPVVTLGRFQPWPESDDRSGFPSIHPCGDLPAPPGSLAAVRRATGGGAILHGDDLTIAIAGDCPSSVFSQRSPTAVANIISSKLSRLFEGHASRRGGDTREASMQHITDCFRRSSPSDVVVDGPRGPIKAGGIALAFRRGRVLIEASLRRDLLEAHPTDDLENLQRLGLLLGLPSAKSSEGDLGEPWQEQISRRVQQRFGDPIWNRG